MAASAARRFTFVRNKEAVYLHADIDEGCEADEGNCDRLKHDLFNYELRIMNYKNRAMNRLPAWKTTKETAHAKRQVYPMTNKPHFHEPDSCTMADIVATQGK